MTQIQQETDSVLILGARGSMPVSGREYLRYGGSTTCVLVRLAGETILLDAGSGIQNLPEEAMGLPQISLLFSHFHADHIIGLPMCPYLAQREGRLDIYAAERSGRDCRSLVQSLASPPLWPVTPEQMPAQVRYHTLQGSFRLGAVSIDLMEGSHPGGVSLFRLTGGGKSLAYMTDTVIDEAALPGLAAFAEGCDALLCDGQYSEEEFQARSDYGHSSWEAAARLGQLCGAAQVRITHHDPGHRDGMLAEAEKRIGETCPNGTFAKEGEVIRL